MNNKRPSYFTWLRDQFGYEDVYEWITIIAIPVLVGCLFFGFILLLVLARGCVMQ